MVSFPFGPYPPSIFRVHLPQTSKIVVHGVERVSI
jgi:hypothetical protein